MAREDLDAVVELEQPAQGVEQPFGALDRADGEIGPGGVAHEERVTGEHEPRLVTARVVDDRQAAVLGSVARRVDHAERDGAHLDPVAVAHGIVRVVDARVGVDADGDAVLEREPAVAGDMVGVGVGLDRAHDANAAPVRFLQQRLDLVGGVDEHRDAGLLVPHEITRTAEIVVQELVEDHDATVAPGPAIALEVASGGSGAGRGGRRRSRRSLPGQRRRRPRDAASGPRHPSRGAR